MNPLDGFILAGQQEIESIKKTQLAILKKLDELTKKEKNNDNLNSPYITANEFMQAVHIRRWKINCLVKSGKIMTVKKKRKIYVPKGEIHQVCEKIINVNYEK
jgi:hypothetical protein